MRRESVVSVSNVNSTVPENTTNETSEIVKAAKENAEAQRKGPNQSEDNVSVTTPSTLNRSNNSSISSQKSLHHHKSSKNTGTKDESCELQDISRRAISKETCFDAHTIDIVDDDELERHKDSLSRKRLWNTSKTNSNHGINKIDAEDGVDGCYNPTFSKSESTVAVDIDDNEEVIDNHVKKHSTSRQARLKKSIDKKSDENVDSSHVHNVL